MTLYTDDIVFLGVSALVLFVCFFVIGRRFGFSKCSKNIFNNSISVIEESDKENPDMLKFFGVIYDEDSVVAQQIINATTTNIIDFDLIQNEIDRLNDIKKDKPKNNHTYNDGLIDGKISGLEFLLESLSATNFKLSDYENVSVNNLL